MNSRNDLFTNENTLVIVRPGDFDPHNPWDGLISVSEVFSGFEYPPRTHKREDEIIELEEGKEVLEVCCEDTRQVLLGALQFGLTQIQLDVFLKAFKGGLYHPYELDNEWVQHSKQGSLTKGKTYRIKEVADSLIKKIESLEDAKLINFFISRVFSETSQGSLDFEKRIAIYKIKELIQKDKLEKEKAELEQKLKLGNPSEFTQEELKPFILKLSKLQGYENPIRMLDHKLAKVKSFNDFDLECNFYLNVHYLCQELKNKFWSDSHKRAITSWLKKAPIVTTVFDETWEEGQNIELEISQRSKHVQSLFKLFKENQDNYNSFLKLLVDLQIIDEEKNYIYSGTKRKFAALLKAIKDHRDENGKAIIINLNKQILSDLFEAEFKGLTKFYQTLRKALSETDQQRIDNDEEIYIEMMQEVSDYFQ